MAKLSKSPDGILSLEPISIKPTALASPTPTSTSTTDSNRQLSPAQNFETDSDGDGFNDPLERSIGTDPNYKCQIPSGVSAWPPEFTNDKKVSGMDILTVVRKVGTIEKRYDLNADGTVTQKDVDIVMANYGKTCQ